MASLKKSVLSWVGERFLDIATVKAVEFVSENYRLVTLQSAEFLKIEWNPGSKIQIDAGDWEVRTYTPLKVDEAKDQFRILLFVHGQGPGSQWAERVRVGDTCRYLGPRSSLSLPAETRSLRLFGDETSFAVAASYVQYFTDWAKFKFVFEVSDLKQAELACSKLGILAHSHLIEKHEDRTHLMSASKLLWSRATEREQDYLVLTGNEASIREVRKSMKAGNEAPFKARYKVYWSLGRTGID